MGDTVGCAICHVQKLEDQFQFQIQLFNIKNGEKKIFLSFLKYFHQSKIIWMGQMAQVTV